MTVERYFKDRGPELKIFRRMVSGQEPRRILDIRAGPGTGKSWLLRRMVLESSQAGFPCALADFAPAWQPGPIKLMRELAERLGEAHFPDFCTQDALYHSMAPPPRPDSEPPGRVDLSDSDFRGAQVRDIAGRDLYDIDLHQHRPPTAAEVERVEQQLSAAFVRELRALAAKGPTVLLLDGCEHIPVETADWLSRRLLHLMRDTPGTWGRLVVVLAGRPGGSRPAFQPWVDCRGVVCALDRLSDFEEQHVRDFFQQWGLHLEATEFAFVYRVCKARPLNMATLTPGPSPYPGRGEVAHLDAA